MTACKLLIHVVVCVGRYTVKAGNERLYLMLPIVYPSANRSQGPTAVAHHASMYEAREYACEGRAAGEQCFFFVLC